MAKTKTKAKTKSPQRKKGAVAAKSAPQRDAHNVDKQYRRKAALSIPMQKLIAGDSFALRIESIRAQLLPSKGIKTAAVLIRSTDLDTGEQFDLIAPTVLVSTLERAYGILDGYDKDAAEIQEFPECPWIGQHILVEASKREDKRYMDVNVYEIEPE